MTEKGHFIIVFIASFAIFITATSSRLHGSTIATLDIINSLPNATVVSCKPSLVSQKSLGPGEDVKVEVTEKSLIYCQAVWGLRYFASWHAYQPARDKNSVTVFWDMKENGIFLSWDKTHWVKKAVWETD